MTIKKITGQLSNAGMPIFWQAYIFLLAISICLSPFLISNNGTWVIYDTLCFIFLLIGYAAAKRQFKKSFLPRRILFYSLFFLALSQPLKTYATYFESIPYLFPLIINGIGMQLIGVYAIFHIKIFEDKFKIKGLAIDFLLLVISITFFLLLISPNIINILINELGINQQILLFFIFIAGTSIALTIVHYYISNKSFSLTDFVRVSLLILAVTHFTLEVLLLSGYMQNSTIAQTISMTSFRFDGVLSVIFIFIEKFTVNYTRSAPFKLGSHFMWTASIVAILSIPLGLIIRYIANYPPINPLLIGAAGILISLIIIGRFIVLIQNSNKQRIKLFELKHTNPLTGISNYEGYLEKLTLFNKEKIFVVSINIEDFKSINDLYGRDTGDDVLKSLASRLKTVSPAILSAHTHSDIFLIIFKIEKSEIPEVIRSLQKTLGVWHTVDNKKITVPLTFGASYAKTITNPETLYIHAEQALKKARNERTSFSLFVERRLKSRLSRHELRDLLQESIDSKQLPVHFQPIYNLHDGSLKALELLIRVDTKEHGLLLPGQFLDQAKSYGLLTSLTEICVRMVAKHYDKLPNVTININLPPYMIKSQKLFDNFIQVFNEENLSPHKFCIEITEDEGISTESLIPAIQRLRDLGFSIAMDDFGTGYSSLDRLSILDIDTVKIDRSLLLTASTGNTAILEWAISLAKRLGVSAVVEGIETPKQLSLIKKLGADSVQGFLYSRPVSAIQAQHIALNSNEIEI